MGSLFYLPDIFTFLDICTKLSSTKRLPFHENWLFTCLKKRAGN